MEAVRYMLTFDYRSRFEWLFDGDGFGLIELTKEGKIATQNSDEYFELDQLKFRFSTPVGDMEVTNLDLKEVKELMREE